VDGATKRRDEVELAINAPLPDSVAELLGFEGLLESIARVHEGHAMFPNEPRLLDATLMPGYSGRLLWLLTENQGVCRWGVPLDDGDDPPVIVGGDLIGGDRSLIFAETIGRFVLAFGWDSRIFWSEPLIQAQAAPLDSDSLQFLRANFAEKVMTYGWPGELNYRFESTDGVHVELWDAPAYRGCDWWISGEPTAVESTVARLMDYSDLRKSFWSNDDLGDGMLKRVRQT